MRKVRFLISLVLAVVALSLVIALWMRFAMAPYIYTNVESAPNAQVALVLGASVARGQPSPILALRADVAVDLYRAHKVQKILVTGDNGALSHDEVTPVRKYLLDNGIPPDDIFLDHAGFDTYSSMYRAQSVFAAESAIIVTQDFHMPRALFIARHLGMRSYGVVAEGESGLSWDYAREVPASIKALLDLVTHRAPRYFGDSIPLSGSGTTTWY